MLIVGDAIAQFKPAEQQYLKSENILFNNGFEQGFKGWTNSAGTFSIDSTREVVGNKAGCVSLTAQTLDLSQTISTGYNTNLSGLQGVASAYIRSDVAGLQVCSLVDGAEQTCLDVKSNSKYDHYNIPTVLGSTSGGIKFKSAAAVTGEICIDEALFGADPARLTNVKNCESDIDCENSFNARVSSTDAVTKENLEWINGNCTNATTGRATCTFQSGVFTLAPNCYGSVEGDYANSTSVNVISVSNTAVTFETVGTAGAFDTDFSIHCEKQGADFQKSESSIVADTSEVCQVEADSNDAEVITQDTEDIPFKTIRKDNCNAWSNVGNTGNNTNDAYTAQKDGYLIFSMNVARSSSGTSETLNIYENGSFLKRCGQGDSPFSYVSSSCVIDATKGNIYSVRFSNVNTTLSGSTDHKIHISELVDYATVVGKFKEVPTIKGASSPRMIAFGRAGSTGQVTRIVGDDPISGNCTVATPSVCTFSTPFTLAPSCTVSAATSGNRNCKMHTNPNTTTVSISCYSDTGTNTTTSTYAYVICTGE